MLWTFQFENWEQIFIILRKSYKSAIAEYCLEKSVYTTKQCYFKTFNLIRTSWKFSNCSFFTMISSFHVFAVFALKSNKRQSTKIYTILWTFVYTLESHARIVRLLYVSVPTLGPLANFPLTHILYEIRRRVYCFTAYIW